MKEKFFQEDGQPSDREIRDCFNAIDQDGTGSIQFSEFIAAAVEGVLFRDGDTQRVSSCVREIYLDTCLIDWGMRNYYEKLRLLVHYAVLL